VKYGVTVRLSRSEREYLRELAETRGETVSDVMRAVLTHRPMLLQALMDIDAQRDANRKPTSAERSSRRVRR
jgi:hypothetical protein